MLDPATNSLLLLYDDAQSLYRNTDGILTCAREFAHELLSPVAADDDGIPRVAPELGGRRGPKPRLALLTSLQQEAQTIVDTLIRLHARGIAWKYMGVLYSAPFVAEEIARSLDAAGVPTEWLRDPAFETVLRRARQHQADDLQEQQGPPVPGRGGRRRRHLAVAGSGRRCAVALCGHDARDGAAADHSEPGVGVRAATAAAVFAAVGGGRLSL